MSSFQKHHIELAVSHWRRSFLNFTENAQTDSEKLLIVFLIVPTTFSRKVHASDTLISVIFDVSEPLQTQKRNIQKRTSSPICSLPILSERILYPRRKLWEWNMKKMQIFWLLIFFIWQTFVGWAISSVLEQSVFTHSVVTFCSYFQKRGFTGFQTCRTAPNQCALESTDPSASEDKSNVEIRLLGADNIFAKNKLNYSTTSPLQNSTDRPKCSDFDVWPIVRCARVGTFQRNLF